MILSKLHNHKQITILLIEDNKSNIILFSLMFEKTYNVIYVKNAKNVLSVYEKHPEIDIVILDLKLSSMNGEEILHEIRQRDSELPILIYTSFVLLPDLINNLNSLGATKVLSKPYSYDMIEKMIHKHCQV